MSRLITQLRRALLEVNGEKPLVKTMWPSDYRCGSVYSIKGQAYSITRYMRVADQQVVEVWGRAIDTVARPVQHDVIQRSTLSTTASLDHR